MAPENSVPQRFERSYEGTEELRRRVRRALTAFAFRTWRFWQTSVYIVCVGVFVAFAVGREDLDVYLPAIIFVFALAAVMLLVGLRDISKVSKRYANRHVTYAASFGVDSFIWQTETGTYEIRWGSVVRSISRRDVTILGLADSRAICVLPEELVTRNARLRLDDIGRNEHAKPSVNGPVNPR